MAHRDDRDPLWDALKQASKEGRKHRQEVNTNRYVRLIESLDRKIWTVIMNGNVHHFTVCHKETGRFAQCWPIANKWMVDGRHKKATFGIKNMLKFLSGEVDHAPNFKPGPRRKK